MEGWLPWMYVLTRWCRCVLLRAKLKITEQWDLTDQQNKMMVGSLNLASAAGALISGPLADKTGRRATLILSCVLSTLGSLVMAVAGNYEIIIAGRAIDGLGVGFGLAIGPLLVTSLLPFPLL